MGYKMNSGTYKIIDEKEEIVFEGEITEFNLTLILTILKI